MTSLPPSRQILETPPKAPQIIRDQIHPREICAYLPERTAQMHYRFIHNCTAETYQKLLERGWRRFGQVFFRPVCEACRECRSLRIDVATFQPNRSMRRTRKRNRDLSVTLQPPTLTREHFQLYQRYHADKTDRSQWQEKRDSPFDYYMTFVDGQMDFGQEILFFLDRQLVAVALVDLLPNALSAVYCYYEPNLRARALGVNSVLWEIDLARQRGLPYVYLGYWVEGNLSMRYKAGYRPHEILAGRPSSDEPATWQRHHTDG